MKKEIHIARKLEKVAELFAEIAKILEVEEDHQPKKKRSFLVDQSLLERSYPLDAQLTRWVTCAEVCREVGIPVTRGNCSSVGHILGVMGFAKARSNGKSLVRLPDLHETF